MYPHQAVADSVPAKWILKHQNVILNLKQNQILDSATAILLHYAENTYSVKQLFTFHYCFIMMARVLYHELTKLKFDKNKFTDYYLLRNFHHVIHMYFENQK